VNKKNTRGGGTRKQKGDERLSTQKGEQVERDRKGGWYVR